MKVKDLILNLQGYEELDIFPYFSGGFKEIEGRNYGIDVICYNNEYINLFEYFRFQDNKMHVFE